MTASPGGSRNPIDEVLDRLNESLPDLAELTCQRIYATLDSYVMIAPEALAAASARNLFSALSALRVMEAPEPQDLVGAAQTSRERYEAGVPVEEIVRGFRISISLIHERFLDLSTALGVPIEEVLNGSRVLWRVADSFTTRIITEYHTLALENALRDTSQRAWLVQRLLAGDPLDDNALVALDRQASYAALRCELPADGDTERVRALLETSGSSQQAKAIVVADAHSCVGLVAQAPQDPGFPVGLGPFVPLGELSRSDQVARMALRLAVRLGRSGIQRLKELGWRLAAVSRPDVWEIYADRFLGPLEEEGDFGAELRVAVLTWLRHQSIPKAAKVLLVHPNTLRYRLLRFQQLTGSDLSDLDDVIGASWALELGAPSPDLS